MTEHRNFDEEYPGGWLDEPGLYDDELVLDLKEHWGWDLIGNPTIIYAIEFCKSNSRFLKIGHTTNRDNRFKKYDTWAKESRHTWKVLGMLAFEDHKLALDYESHLLLVIDQTDRRYTPPKSFPNPTEVCVLGAGCPWEDWSEIPEGAKTFEQWLQENGHLAMRSSPNVIERVFG